MVRASETLARFQDGCFSYIISSSIYLFLVYYLLHSSYIHFCARTLTTLAPSPTPVLGSTLVFSARLLQIPPVTTFLFLRLEPTWLSSTTICWSNSQSPSANSSNFLFQLGPGPAQRQYIAALIRLVDPRDPRPRSLP
ncbi:hypothetical protein BDV10DRAFT_96902 [Aspergillus recurvatus]